MDELDASKEYCHPLEGFVLPDPLPCLDGAYCYLAPAEAAGLSALALLAGQGAWVIALLDQIQV